MDIKEHFQSVLSEIISQIVLYTFTLGNSHFGLSFLPLIKASIEVFPLQIASIIAKHHPIWVGYRYDPEFQMVSQPNSCGVLRHKEIDKTVNYVARMCFARVLSAQDAYHWLLVLRVESLYLH